MKNILLIIGILLNTIVITNGQFIAGFENQGLALDTFDIDGSSGAGYWSGDIFFPNNYNADFNSWTDWAVSTKRDTVTEGFSNPLSSFAGSGKASDTYAVASAFFPVTFRIVELSAGKTVSGLYVTNNTYAALSMRNGDSFAKKFGGESGDDPDFFKLTIKKWLNGELSSDSIDFYLADFRFEDDAMDYIVKDWTYVDLQSLGGVDSLTFSVTSSDVGAFGMNTPAFFCLDNIGVEMLSGAEDLEDEIDLKIYPNPTSDYLSVIGTEMEGVYVRIYNLSGKLVKSRVRMDKRIDIRDLPKNNFYLVLEGKEWVKAIPFSKI